MRTNTTEKKILNIQHMINYLSGAFLRTAKHLSLTVECSTYKCHSVSGSANTRRRERRGSSLIGHAASWDLSLRKCNMHQQVMVLQQQGRKRQGEIFHRESALVMMRSVYIQMDSSIDHSFPPPSCLFFSLPNILQPLLCMCTTYLYVSQIIHGTIR